MKRYYRFQGTINGLKQYGVACECEEKPHQFELVALCPTIASREAALRLLDGVK